MRIILSFLLDALTQEKPVRYTNTDRKGNVYKDMLALPVSIEYSNEGWEIPGVHVFFG